MLLDEVKALRMEVQEMKDQDGDPEEMDDYGLGKIGKILQHPQIGPMAQQLVGAVVGWLNGNKPGAAAQVIEPGRVISGVPGTQHPADKISEALAILNKAYPDFPDLLTKLATMRQNTLHNWTFILMHCEQ